MNTPFEKTSLEIETLQLETQRLRWQNQLAFEKNLQRMLQDAATVRAAKPLPVQPTLASKANERHDSLWYPVVIAVALIAAGGTVGALLSLLLSRGS